jgi:hypothetical protein
MAIARRRFTMAGKAKISAPTRELYYRMPESDHEDLGQLRDELGMLAQFTFRYCCDKDELIHVSPMALAQCFARLSEDIAEIMEHCLAPSDFETPVNRSRH